MNALAELVPSARTVLALAEANGTQSAPPRAVFADCPTHGGGCLQDLVDLQAAAPYPHG